MSFLQVGHIKPSWGTFKSKVYLCASSFFHCDGVVDFVVLPLQRKQSTAGVSSFESVESLLVLIPLVVMFLAVFLMHIYNLILCCNVYCVSYHD